MAAAKAHLAAELGVPSGSIEAIAIEPVEWSDASLGCPTPGVVYAQVVTPGYRIVLEVDAKEYELHTDKSGRAVVVCERELEKGPIAAVEYLANELGISAEGVEVLSVDAYEWPDAGLGCPEPGRSYAQVLTPGYRVIVEAAGEQHEVHTDREGEIIVICEPEP